MGMYPPSLERLIAHLTKLPGIGQKSATRVALFILRSDRTLAEGLATCLRDVKDRITLCSSCFNLTDEDPCPICTDPGRADGTLCVVEGPGDMLAIEQTGFFKGRYHVLHGVLSPLDGVGPEDLKIQDLLRRISREGVKELILATNPTAEGETTASYLAGVLGEASREVKVSRIALGIPMGGDLKFTDRMTLQHAMRYRMQVS